MPVIAVAFPDESHEKAECREARTRHPGSVSGSPQSNVFPETLQPSPPRSATLRPTLPAACFRMPRATVSLPEEHFPKGLPVVAIAFFSEHLLTFGERALIEILDETRMSKPKAESQHTSLGNNFLLPCFW